MHMTASTSFLFTCIPIFHHTIHPHAWYPSYPSLIPIILLTYPSSPFLSLHHTSHPSHYPFSFSHTHNAHSSCFFPSLIQHMIVPLTFAWPYMAIPVTMPTLLSLHNGIPYHHTHSLTPSLTFYHLFSL